MFSLEPNKSRFPYQCFDLDRKKTNRNSYKIFPLFSQQRFVETTAQICIVNVAKIGSFQMTIVVTIAVVNMMEIWIAMITVLINGKTKYKIIVTKHVHFP